VRWTQAGLVGGSIWLKGYIFLGWTVTAGGTGNIDALTTYGSVAFTDAANTSITVSPRVLPYDPGSGGGDDGNGENGGQQGISSSGLSNGRGAETGLEVGTSVLPEMIASSVDGNDGMSVSPLEVPPTPIAQAIGADGTWALLNLLLTALVAAFAILILFAFIRRRRAGESTGRSLAMTILAAAVFGGLAVLFMSLENITGTMQIYNARTVVYVAVAAIQAIILVMSQALSPIEEE